MSHGKLQISMPMDKIKEISQLSLMVSFYNMESLFRSKRRPNKVQMFIFSLFELSENS